MRNANSIPIQYSVETGIATRLIDSAARQRMRLAKELNKGCYADQVLIGDVFKDTIALGVGALLAHVVRYLETDPIRCLTVGDGQLRIRVFGALDYVVDQRQRRVWLEPSPLTKREEMCKQRSPWNQCVEPYLDNVDLLNPLCKPAWLMYIVARPGLLPYTSRSLDQNQRHLFTSIDALESALFEMIEKVGEVLQNCSAMTAARHRIASMLVMTIDVGLVDLALRSRLYPANACLLAQHLNLVWSNLPTFQTMERENPRLLVALAAWLTHEGRSCVVPGADAIPLMKNAILATGLSQKAWRVLAENGLRRLLPSQLNRSVWQSLILSLKALDASRWPSLAPRGFLRLMHDSAGRPDTFNTSIGGVPGWFWQIVCNEAFDLRGNAKAYQELFDSVPRWAWLVRKYAFHPDKNQLRRGCSWLRGAVQFHQDLEDGEDNRNAPAWALWVQAAQWCTGGKLLVVPLLTPSALVAEGRALHNCADNYISRCQRGNAILFSIRDKFTGRRHALVSTIRRGRHWAFDQIAGPCNEPVQPYLEKYAKQALIEVNRQYSAFLLEKKVPVEKELGHFEQ